MMLNTQILANQPLEIYEPLDFLRVMFAEAALDITYYRNHAEVYEADQVKGGYAEEFTQPVHKTVIRSATNQQIQIVGRLGAKVSYDTPPEGLVQVTNTPNVIVQSARDEAAARTKAGVSGYARHGYAAGTGNYPHIILMNSESSGRNLIVQSAILIPTVSGFTGLHLRDTGVSIGSYAMSARPKKIGDAVSGVLNVHQANTAAGSATLSYRAGSQYQACEMIHGDPIVIPPGKGLIALGTTVASLLEVTFEFYEEPI